MNKEIELGKANGCFWELAGGYDCTEFFRALKLFVNKNVILYVEGTSINEKIEKKYTQFKILALHSIHPGTTWPKSKKFHLALNADLINELVEISDNYAVPEYADHIVLYSDEILIEAYDFTTGPCYLSGKLSEPFVDEFARYCNTSYLKKTENTI
jgi:hypothetical protein